jgi:preprotein translocase subunit YajC
MPQQLQGFLLPIGFLVIFYIFAIRPQKKKETQVKEMRNSLRVGDEVITIGGINGKIIKVKEDIVTIEVGTAKTKLDMTKWAIGSVVNKNESKNNKNEEINTTEENE